jgi:hypothetical protein
MRLVDDPCKRLLVAPKAAGVRRGFTRERLPDGTFTNTLDPALSRLESAVAMLEEMQELWPLTGQHRSRFAQLLAAQILRSPAWRTFYVKSVPTARTNVREDHPEVPDHKFAEVESLLLSDSHRHRRLLWQLPLIATAVANMHWTLLYTQRPRLVTGDQPVVAIDCGQLSARNPDAVPPGGLVNVEEFRFALRPDLLLVACWHDAPDDALRRLAKHQIRNHNSLVIAQADRQWFHHPEVEPSFAPGTWQSLSRELHEGYNPAAARRSARRKAAENMVIGPIEAGELQPREVAFVEWQAAA